MAVKLHRCKFTNPLVNKFPGHACGRVEKALEAAGIEYERVPASNKRMERSRVIELSGQQLVPMIEFENGVAYRADSKVIAAEIKAGRLFDHAGESDGTTAEAATEGTAS